MIFIVYSWNRRSCTNHNMINVWNITHLPDKCCSNIAYAAFPSILIISNHAPARIVSFHFRFLFVPLVYLSRYRYFTNTIRTTGYIHNWLIQRRIEIQTNSTAQNREREQKAKENSQMLFTRLHLKLMEKKNPLFVVKSIQMHTFLCLFFYF